MAPEPPAGQTTCWPEALKHHTRSIPRPSWVDLRWGNAGFPRSTAERWAAVSGRGTVSARGETFLLLGVQLPGRGDPSGKALEEEACPQVRI